ncbi:hypothetical protein MNBD_NITROSPINAE04-1807 [hydrothermal vent metagenome]|uniref:Cytochrome c domain-containing protein n=1 Tax=hydrothermal vent metagenome TaxID=652676 RepID=A0A3B1BYT2_9ZZZZ
MMTRAFRHIYAVVTALLFTAQLTGVAGADPLAELVKNGEIIPAHMTNGAPPTGPGDTAWGGAGFTDIELYPQISVQPASVLKKSVVKIKAIYNAGELTIYAKWSDDQLSLKHDIGKFPDSFAIEFPFSFGAGKRLPYIGMGDPGQPVAVILWKAGDKVETLTAEGFGSLTPMPIDGVKASGVWRDGVWRVTITLKLTGQDDGSKISINPASPGLLPVAFAVWRGDKQERDGKKSLSSWKFLHFTAATPDPGYVKSLTWADEGKGDASKGKKLMKSAGCADCHTYPGSKETPTDGPNLAFAGGTHRPQYLIDSILRPSLVILPKKEYYTVEDGKKESIMPDPYFPKKDAINIVEYLRTLR